MVVPYTSSALSQYSPALAHNKEAPMEAASPAIRFSRLYNRPLSVAQPQPIGSKFSAWHKLPSTPQSLQEQGTSQQEPCWTWGKPAETDQEQATLQSYKHREVRDSCLILLTFPPPFTAPWGWEQQSLGRHGRNGSTTAVCWSSSVQKWLNQILT